MIEKSIGARLLQIRTERSETALSLSCSLDLPPDLIERWESGAERIPAARLVQIAQLLDCKISAFFDGLPA